MSLCVTAGGATMAIAAQMFTLAWTHSVEKTRWEETWEITDQGLVAREARIEASGAGMEPPEGAVLEDGAWIYRPALPPLPELVLARSGATGEGWRLCAGGTCREIGGEAGVAVRLAPCGHEQR